MKYVKHERISVREHPEIDEKWVQARIAEDPAILGLGDLVLRDKERTQPRAGRLDLLLQDTDTDRRYEVELQLGATDETHIIRTIEYWDLERKRYPQYDHCAVIVAENITARFLNVISLFNGTIPLIAIQMSLLKVEDRTTLVFTKVLDEMQRGLVGEDEDVFEEVDRRYWEARSTKEILSLTDELLKVVRAVTDERLELKYNKGYVGLASSGIPNNFVLFRPLKNTVNFEARLDRSEEVDKLIEDAGLDAMPYEKRWNRYRLRIDSESLKRSSKVLEELSRRSFDAHGK